MPNTGGSAFSDKRGSGEAGSIRYHFSRWASDNMKISEISDILKATVLVGRERLDVPVTGGGSADLMEDVLAAATEGCVLLTGAVSEQMIRTAKVARVAAIVIVRGKKPGDAVVKLADSYGLPLLLTKDSLFVASGKLYMAGMRGLDGSW